MQAFLAAMLEKSTEWKALSILEVCMQLGASIILGLVLVVVTFLSARGSAAFNPAKIKKVEKAALVDRILGSANVLLCTVGLTSVLILVNDNVVRALSIFAAITLIRFRVKLDTKGLNASLMYSVIVGIACGLNEILIGGLITAVYAFLMIGLGATVSFLNSRKEAQDLVATTDASIQLRSPTEPAMPATLSVNLSKIPPPPPRLREPKSAASTGNSLNA